MTRILTAVALMALLCGCATSAQTDDGLTIVAGAIRPAPDGTWYLIDDVNHRPIGVESVRGRGGTVVIEYAEASAVVTFVIVPDETMAALGYTMGASVRKDAATITISPEPGADLFEARLPNAWFYGLMEP